MLPDYMVILRVPRPEARATQGISTTREDYAEAGSRCRWTMASICDVFVNSGRNRRTILRFSGEPGAGGHRYWWSRYAIELRP